jgi:hypothetical protein
MRLVIAAVVAGLAGLFIRSANSSRGPAYRFVQWFYYRYASLEQYRKSGRRYRGARDVMERNGGDRLPAVVSRIVPSQAGWFASRVPTDKDSYHDYLRHYDRLLRPYMDQEGLALLEVGVKKGGSMVLWRELFPDSASIWGLDINPDVPIFPRDAGIKVLVLDSTDADEVQASLRGRRFHIIIDDGFHTPEAQLATFNALYPFLEPTGIYIIEDVEEFDPDRYSRPGLDVSVYPDPSGQRLVVLCPEHSRARQLLDTADAVRSV